MARLFMSYAAEDARTARELAAWFTARKHEVYWWQDPAERGAEFIGRIENEISRADAFILLLSPHLLASGWCRKERDLAMHREMDLRPAGEGHTFIYVLQVAKTPYAESGFLRNYDWFDLASGVWEDELSALAGKLDVNVEKAANVGAANRTGTVPMFRNRSDELNKVLDALTNAGGQHFWLVIAPPQLGKSWFLDRLPVELVSRSLDWTVRLVDLKDEPLEARVDSAMVLARLFGVERPAEVDSGTLRDIAVQISKGEKPYLCLLDSADLLEKDVIRRLRSDLNRIYELVQSAGKGHIRLAFVAASRQHEEWRGIDPSQDPGTRISSLALTEFKVHIVKDALRDVAVADNRNFSERELWENANRVHRLSAGLPALLVRSLQWITETEFVELERLERQETFEQIARPYIQEQLLSLDSLFPAGGEQLVERRNALELAFRAIAPYRLFTLSHLRHHVESDTDFKAVLAGLGWSIEYLWRAVGDTALLRQPLDEPWQEIYPAIRRLLYRYYYTTDENRIRGHRAARRFYEGWADKDAGKEQSVVVVECLWHEAAFLALDRPTEMEQALIKAAHDLSQAFGKSSVYEPEELKRYTIRRMRDDEELQEVVSHLPGLFDDLIRTVEGGGSG